MEQWPKHLPNPAANFNMTAEPNGSRTKMSSGYTRQRPMTNRSSYSANVSFELSDGDYEAFKAFVAYGVNNGFDWFECPLATGGGVVNRTVRIVGGKYKANYVQYMAWRVTFTVDIKDIGVPNEAYWNIINSPQTPKEGWYSLLNALELCVNGRNI